MPMPPRLIIVKFSCKQPLEQFADQLGSSPAFIPLKKPLSADTPVVLFLTAPDLETPVVGRCVACGQTGSGSEVRLEEGFSIPSATAPAPSKPPSEPPAAAASEIFKSPETPAARPASFDWIKNVVSQEERELDLSPLPDFSGHVMEEKKTLTPEERDRIQPVGEWIMNLAKAILRTGYYDPSHPGTAKAKHGLYEEFVKVMGGCPELLLTVEETRQQTDILVSGILDAPVSVRTVVGKGAAALFVPKLFDYFEKKKLLSVAIKKGISLDHFETFVRIMSDPRVDQGSARQAGQLLTAALVKHNITEISTVFDNDQLNFEKNLPWRVEIAMQRLAKDLKLLPMFTGISPEALWEMKQQSIQDIIRPLRHPKLFNDFLVNCYIIAEHVSHMEPPEIEQIIVDAFPANLLLATSRYTFEELDWLNEKAAADPDNERIARRLHGIRRILKGMARRVALEEISGGQMFLAYLYNNEILSFEELPADAQYVINTRAMAEDVRLHAAAHVQGLISARDDDAAMVYLKCFRRVAPLLIENRDWEVLQAISEGIAHAGARLDGLSLTGPETLVLEKDAEKEEPARILEIFDYIFSAYLDQLCQAYEESDNTGRERLDQMFSRLGYLGIQVFGRILSKSQDREVRARSVKRLSGQAQDAKKWVSGLLRDANQPWYINRNALMILRQVSTDPADAELARPFVRHDHPRLRLEVLNVIVALKPHDAESLVIELLDDPDSRIAWRALNAVSELPVATSAGIHELLDRITARTVGDAVEVSAELKQKARLMTAVAGLSGISRNANIESRILELIQPMASVEKKRLSLLKRSGPSADELQILKAAISLLARVGGDFSASFLKSLARAHADLADPAQRAIYAIEHPKKESAS